MRPKTAERQEYSTGMMRDTSTNKARYDLLDMPMLARWADLMARGAEKYGAHNWKKAETQEELDRFRESAIRHFFQWFSGDTDEDHAAAVYFNIAGAEMVKTKLLGGLTAREIERLRGMQNVGFSNIRPLDARQG